MNETVNLHLKNDCGSYRKGKNLFTYNLKGHLQIKAKKKQNKKNQTNKNDTHPSHC